VAYHAALVLARTAVVRQRAGCAPDDARAAQRLLRRLLAPAAAAVGLGPAWQEIDERNSEPSERQAPPSACLVALEALGSSPTPGAGQRSVDVSEGGQGGQGGQGCQEAYGLSMQLLARTLGSPCADAGTRAIAARALAQQCAQGALLPAGRYPPQAEPLLGCSCAASAVIGSLSAALASDGDRYVRGYAADALASAFLVRGPTAAESKGHGGGELQAEASGAVEVVRRVLSSTVSAEDVDDAWSKAHEAPIDGVSPSEPDELGRCSGSHSSHSLATSSSGRRQCGGCANAGGVR
jgi:hypothetical protein